MAAIASVAQALAALGWTGSTPPAQPILPSGPAGTLIALALVGPQRETDWRGLWVEGPTAHSLGEPAPASLLAQRLPLSANTAALVDLLEGSMSNYVQRLEELDERLDDDTTDRSRGALGRLEATHRTLSIVRRQVRRLAIVVAALEGPGCQAAFPDLGRAYPELEARVHRLESFSLSVEGAFRDSILLRNAVEGNRISAVANDLGATSNRIASLANNSNIRMLGIAYLALVLGLIGAVVLIPETAATILGMPSAGWVPGGWVVVIVAVTTLVPILVVFSRPWMIRILRGLGSFELRSSEGVRDLPETAADGSARPPGPGAAPDRIPPERS